MCPMVPHRSNQIRALGQAALEKDVENGHKRRALGERKRSGASEDLL